MWFRRKKGSQDKEDLRNPKQITYRKNEPIPNTDQRPLLDWLDDVCIKHHGGLPFEGDDYEDHF